MSSEQLCFGSPKITLSHSISLEGLGKVIRCSYGVRHSKGLEVTSQESGKALASENTGCGLLLSNPLLHPKTIRTSLGLQLTDQIVRHLSLQNYVSQYLKINLFLSTNTYLNHSSSGVCYCSWIPSETCVPFLPRPLSGSGCWVSSQTSGTS